MSLTRIAFYLLLPAILFQACGGTELAPEEREVQLDQPALEWRPATKDDLPGFYLSRRIEGEAAGSVLSMEYLFQEDGTYTGAALVLGEDGKPAFQTLSGTWRLGQGRLILDEGEPADVAVAPNHLRLKAATGVVVFERRPLL